MTLGRKILCLDVGSRQIRLIVPKKGLVLDEPNVAIRNSATAHFERFGESAVQGRLAKHEEYVRPFNKGVIADFPATSQSLRHHLTIHIGRFQLIKPLLIITMSANANSTEQRALLEAIPTQLISRAYPIPATQAAALGAGLAIHEPRGSMVIHVGAGATEVAMFSYNEPVTTSNLRVGGDDLTDAISRALKKLGGDDFAKLDPEQVKHEYLDLAPPKTPRPLSPPANNRRRGRSIQNENLITAVEPMLEKIVASAKQVIEQSSPELISDIYQSGIVLTGGTALLKGLDTYLTKKLRVNCVVAREPMLCVVRGANLATTFLRDYQKSLE